MIFLITLLFLISLANSVVLDLHRASGIALKGNREILRIKREIASLEDTFLAQRRERFMPTLDMFIDREGLSLFSKILLLDFGNRLALIDSRRLKLKIKRELNRELERQIKIKLAQLFMELALAEKRAEVAREEMAVTYVRFDRERERLERGLSNRVLVAEWESKYRQNRAKLLKAQREYNEILLEIKRFLGLSLEEAVEMDIQKLLNFPVEEEKTIDVKFVTNRIRDNYLVRIKNLEIEYFESRAKEQKRIFYPELYAYFEVKNKFGSNLDSFKGSANLVLSLPLFDGKASFYRFRSYLELRRAIEIEKRDILETLKKKALISPYEWEELVSAYQDALTYDRWAMENLDLSRSNYELELAFDLGYAMSTKTEAEMRVMEAKFRIILYLMRLYDMMGLDPLRVFGDISELFTEKVEEL